MMGEVIADELKRLDGVVSSVFSLVPLAEEAMRVAGLSPEQQDELFLELNPSGFTGHNPRLYELHVAELCGRKKAGEDLEPGTAAEVMMALCEMSLKAPLEQRAGAFYQRLFDESFGPLDDAADIPEPWEGACDELLAEMRRRLARVRAPEGV